MRENNEQERATLEAMAEKASKGDRIALYNLCEKLAGDILFRTRYILGNEMDAEDVSQDVLLRMCENIQSLREPKAFRAWLGGIVVNEARRHVSRNAKRATVTSIDDHTADAVEDTSAPTPAELAEKSVARKNVMEIISGLPLRQREAVMLHYYEDLAVTEVARAMNIPHQSVSRYLSLAQKKLAIELKKDKYASSAGAFALAPLGATMSDTFHSWAMEFAPSSMGWAQGTLVQCQRQILTSISATGNASGSAAARMPFAAIVGSMTSIIITAVLALGLAMGDSAPRASDAGQAQAPTAEGRIIFTGGETYRGTVRVNPKYAEPWIEGDEGNLRVLKWWVTLAGRDAILYEGEADEVDELFLMLRDNGMYGEYNMVFRFEDEAGVVYRLSSNFYIQELPLNQGIINLTMLDRVM